MCGLVAYLGRTPARRGRASSCSWNGRPRIRGASQFNAYVVDKAFQPAAGANVLLTAGEQVVSMEPTGRGYYRATLDWGPAQSVVATAQAELNGSFLGERTIATNLPPVRDEMSCVDLDEPFLRALAERVRARYVHIDDLDENAAKLFVPRRQTRNHRDRQQHLAPVAGAGDPVPAALGRLVHPPGDRACLRRCSMIVMTDSCHFRDVDLAECGDIGEPSVGPDLCDHRQRDRQGPGGPPRSRAR